MVKITELFQLSVTKIFSLLITVIELLTFLK